MLDFRRLEACTLPRAESARWRGFSAFQQAFVAVATLTVAVAAYRHPQALFQGAVALFAAAFVFISCLRVLLALVSRRPESLEPLDDSTLPRYTILCALHDEAEVVGQLIENLKRLDYPAHRLEGFLVLEAHDHETQRAAKAARKPDWLQVIVVPPGHPQTKPRALNEALIYATGDLVTVYDAEDEPDPMQLREAAARFEADTTGRLGCLQAPLRIRRRYCGLEPSPFMDRQFTAEYAALFEVVLPGLTRLGFPFPLGGTSNHFRTEVVRAVGGWDAHNVTEDADLGFRLWRRGYRLGTLSRPTLETPPGPVRTWLPQRTRWLKGYLQTFGVHTRWPWRLGVKGLLALVITVGVGLLSASLHGPSVALLVAALALALADGQPPQIPILALLVFSFGVISAWMTCAIGARRAGVRYGLADMAAAPAYWSLLSLAFAHAFYRLVRNPFVWDKTQHRLDAPSEPQAFTALDAAALGGLSAAHAASPEPVA